MMDSKTCTKCGVTKPLDGFNPDGTRKSGRRPQCKDCQKCAAASYYAENQNRLRSSSASYYAANPHIQWEKGYRRRAKEFGFLPVVESFTRADLLARYGDACAHCGGPFEHLDHYPVPVALGGAHSLDNCRPSCKACNLSQGYATSIARSIPSR